MKSTKMTFEQAPNQNWSPTFQQVPGLNAPAVDYSLLKNKP